SETTSVEENNTTEDQNNVSTEETVIADSTNVATNEVEQKSDSVAIANNELVNDKEEKDQSLWEIFLLGVTGGLLALVMPCIFPMLPLTVSLFTKQSKTQAVGISKALIYGLSIVFIFVSVACLATWIFGPSTLNEFSTDPWVNIAFFVIFVFFAISF